MYVQFKTSYNALVGCTTSKGLVDCVTIIDNLQSMCNLVRLDSIVSGLCTAVASWNNQTMLWQFAAKTYVFLRSLTTPRDIAFQNIFFAIQWIAKTSMAACMFAQSGCNCCSHTIVGASYGIKQCGSPDWQCQRGQLGATDTWHDTKGGGGGSWNYLDTKAILLP